MEGEGIKISEDEEVVDYHEHRAATIEKRFNVDDHYSQMAEMSEQENCDISKIQQ